MTAQQTAENVAETTLAANAILAWKQQLERAQKLFAPLNDEQLRMPNPLDSTRTRFPTLGDFACYIMTGHLGYHLGQLSGWRGAAGLPLRPGAASAV